MKKSFRKVLFPTADPLNPKRIRMYDISTREFPKMERQLLRHGNRAEIPQKRNEPRGPHQLNCSNYGIY